ncbi:hypothetical protein V6L77_15395 [Pannonibacter sp. Pt2-lr]
MTRTAFKGPLASMILLASMAPSLAETWYPYDATEITLPSWQTAKPLT